MIKMMRVIKMTQTKGGVTTTKLTAKYNNKSNKDLVRQGILASGKGLSTGFALVNERHTRRDNILKYMI